MCEMGKRELPFHTYHPLGGRFGEREDSAWTVIKAAALSIAKCSATQFLHTISFLSSIPENGSQNTRVKKLCSVCSSKSDIYSTDGAQDDFRRSEDEHFLF